MALHADRRAAAMLPPGLLLSQEQVWRKPSPMTPLVVADVGGTHARFAIAEVADGRVVSLGEPVTLKAAEHASFQLAWAAFADRHGSPLPRRAAIAVACPVDGELLKLTNSPWVIRPALIDEALSLDHHLLLNDFEAVAHAVTSVPTDQLIPLTGPTDWSNAGVTTVVGPGTGLGVAQLVRDEVATRVIATEGGHIDWAPLDSPEDAILAQLRERFGRVSVERVACGPGLGNLYEALARIEHRAVARPDERTLWAAALDGSDKLAVAAFDRFCLILGAVSGDLALAHGANAVVLAGGLGARIAERLPRSGFADRFVAKGRFEARMRAIPVRIIIHPEPGLLGAAAAYAGVHP